MTTFIGREDELERLVGFVDAGRSGLVLVLGRRRVGKRQVMQALRSELAERHHVRPPVDREDPTAPALLSVGPDTTIEDIKGRLRDRAGADHDSTRSGGSRVLFLYGYQPSAVFARWFRGVLVPGLTGTDNLRRRSPVAAATSQTAPASAACVVVLAAEEGDVRGLVELASHVEPLGPLTDEAIRAHFELLAGDLSEPLIEAELEAYVRLVHRDAGLLRCLESVLPLDSGEAMPA